MKRHERRWHALVAVQIVALVMLGALSGCAQRTLVQRIDSAAKLIDGSSKTLQATQQAHILSSTKAQAIHDQQANALRLVNAARENMVAEPENSKAMLDAASKLNDQTAKDLTNAMEAQQK